MRNYFCSKALVICIITLSMGIMSVPKAQAVLFPVIENGCSPDFWKDHTAEWPASGFFPGQSIHSVFIEVPSTTLSRESLLQAVMFQGGDDQRFYKKGQE